MWISMKWKTVPIDAWIETMAVPVWRSSKSPIVYAMPAMAATVQRYQILISMAWAAFESTWTLLDSIWNFIHWFANLLIMFLPFMKRHKCGGPTCGSFTVVRVSSVNGKCGSNRESTFHSFEVRTFPISVPPVGVIIGRDLILSYVKLLP